MADSKDAQHKELPEEHIDPLIKHLHRIIRQCVRVLAVLMVAVIVWGIGDVLYVLYQRLLTPPMFLLNINDIFYTFGAFMAVLIAIEIFINIRLYLESNDFPVKLVVATALMAIARKVIVLDVEKMSADYILAIAVTVLALGVTYWLLHKEHKPSNNR
ncbi:MAG: phosphate-starvation-inducible PsiE family protein [Gammaproteobacteria bacterium]|nr:phosphate-starvation-inducible PsiE family protein [Gammaproteobacteria bacterium]MBU1556615.1 phosphate-starvation-inducible PsiE family protein [Gammaproteobacteria bacterium]MBU2070295.1 phosphate-starvation-inducible PsiE family protein [Gammaproteobacteria bacterium]MBU2185333.1 phosphate-starvation-inducible PsiE family protein [Gammaproteobacteria bacterium]MBU2203573.1 phosphate-starvation-inducible PsiE family protein [Gammaproteobacteria bacterium]